VNGQLERLLAVRRSQSSASHIFPHSGHLNLVEVSKLEPKVSG